MTEVSDHPSIDAYLKEARKAWNQRQGLPDSDKLRATAEAVDMSPEASEAADQRAYELTRRAQKALDGDGPGDPESLLIDAVLLSPIRLQPHYLLATIYADRYGDDGDLEDRRRAIELAKRAQELSPEHGPSRTVIEKLGETPQDGLSWKKAALIVLVIVAISGSLQLCHRHFVAPEVTDEQLEEVRQYLEEHGEPRR